MAQGRRIDNPYSVACEWIAASPRVRVALTAGRANDFRRISRLEPAWGQRLDALGVTYDMIRWVAGAAGPAYALERETRYRKLVRVLETATPEQRWARFEEIRQASPRLGRRWAEHARRVPVSDVTGASPAR